MDSPTVSVLILNYRNANATVECVRSFMEQTITDNIEIIVIDNHSSDDSIGVLRNRLSGIPNVRIVETPQNHGFGYGYNKGATYATGEYLLINNPDKRLPPDGIEKLVAAYKADASVGILAPKLVHADGSRRYSIRTFPRILDVLSRRSYLGSLFPKHLRRYLMLDADPNICQEVDWVVGGCFLITKQLFRTLEGFDERFFLFFEDTDLCRRCRTLGRTVLYEPAVVASDKRNRLSGEKFFDLIFKKTGRIHIVSAIRYFTKWGIFA